MTPRILIIDALPGKSPARTIRERVAMMVDPTAFLAIAAPPPEIRPYQVAISESGNRKARRAARSKRK